MALAAVPAAALAATTAPQSGGREKPSAPLPWFVQLESGAPAHTYQTGSSGERYLPEIMGGGGALLDFDRDGDLDLFLVQGGALGPRVDAAARRSDQLFRSQLEAGKPESLAFVPVDAGITGKEHAYGMGAASADFDNDGFPDLYVLNLGPNELWSNRGDGTFEAIGEASGVADPRWSTSASAADFDGDGWIDLYVVNYVDFQFHRHRQCPAPNSKPDYCGPLNYPGSADRLYRNLGPNESGQLRFVEVTKAAGVLAPTSRGLGSLAADLDRDGRIDLYVANDQMANHFWLNVGNDPATGHPRFVDEALLAGVAVNANGEAEASMGVAASDFDRDGDLDLLLTHLRQETNTLYVNDGQALFLDQTAASGLGTPSFPYTGFGAAWLDLENDGWLDLAVVNGTIKSVDEQRDAGDTLPLRQPNQLFRRLPPAPGESAPSVEFLDVSADAGSGFTTPAVSRGLLAGDLDNDGDADLVVIDLDEPAKVLLNAQATSHHWVGLRLEAQHGGQALGAMVRLVTDSGEWTALVHTDGSYLSARDERVLFGLGKAQPRSALVLWPSGKVEEFPVQADRYQTLREGQAQAPGGGNSR